MTDKNIDSNLIRGKVTLCRAENRETLLPAPWLSLLPLNHPSTVEYGEKEKEEEKENGPVNVSPSIRNRIDPGNSSIVLPSLLIKGKIKPLVKFLRVKVPPSPLYIYSNTFRSIALWK